ncbi:hypothetical protein KEM48_004675 [Puccinia striiformis f. sp. tritici PST-130]|nr:hypothetical protein KEM48_004675 [Puccinia striiformis f. sp. tritici PST-130]
MKLRLETDNWASGNCYDYFISCSATCKKKRKKPRLVDLVDIRGQRRQLIEFANVLPTAFGSFRWVTSPGRQSNLKQASLSHSSYSITASGATAISTLSRSPWPSTIGLSLDRGDCVSANANMPETL